MVRLAATSNYSLPNSPGGWSKWGTRYDKNFQDMTDAEFNSFAELDARNRRRIEQAYGVGEFDPNRNSNNAISGAGTGGNQSSIASIGIGGIGGIEDITKQAKDLAQFRLGLDFQQMDKSAGLREQESANNFGRTQKLTDQTFDWQRKINTDTLSSQEKRNLDTIGGQKDMQNTGINQENFAARRAIGLASRRLGG